MDAELHSIDAKYHLSG